MELFDKKDEIKEKKKWTFHFKCTKCSFKFSVERDSPDMNKIDVQKMKCMECKSDIMWDSSNFPSSAAPSYEAHSKANVEASRMAMEMANRQRMMDRDMGAEKMVPVTSSQPGKNYGKTEMLPEKAIKSIEEKITPILDEIKE